MAGHRTPPSGDTGDDGLQILQDVYFGQVHTSYS
jgi:hypothetical protein